MLARWRVVEFIVTVLVLPITKLGLVRHGSFAVFEVFAIGLDGGGSGHDFRD